MCLLKPSKEIVHDTATGAMKIRTITTFRNFNMEFTIGEEFIEDLGPVDGRSCNVRVVCQDMQVDLSGPTVQTWNIRCGCYTCLLCFILECLRKDGPPT